jgi:hypothetical protein
VGAIKVKRKVSEKQRQWEFGEYDSAKIVAGNLRPGIKRKLKRKTKILQTQRLSRHDFTFEKAHHIVPNSRRMYK